MIAKGASRSGARQLAVYLMRVERWDTGEPTALLELRSPWAAGIDGADRHHTADQLIEAFRDWQTLVEGTKQGRDGLYHAEISPAVKYAREMTPEQWKRCADVLGEELGLQDQPRAVVLHGGTDGRPHLHVVWARTDIDTMKVVSDAYNYIAHEKASQRMELEFGHEFVPGKHAKRDRRKQPEFPREKLSQDEAQQAERLGMTKQERIVQLAEIRKPCDDGQAFKNALEQAGYILARGDKRGFVLVDQDGEMFSLTRYLPELKGTAFKEFMAPVDPAGLPSVEEAKALQQRHAAKAEQQAPEASKFLESQPAQKPAEPQAAPADAAPGAVEEPAPVAKAEPRKPEPVDPVRKAQITALRSWSDSVFAFKAALEQEGYTLARGQTGYLLFSEEGTFSLMRHAGLSKARFEAFMSPIPLEILPDIKDLIEAQRQARQDSKFLTPDEAPPPPFPLQPPKQGEPDLTTRVMVTALDRAVEAIAEAQRQASPDPELDALKKAIEQREAAETQKLADLHAGELRMAEHAADEYYLRGIDLFKRGQDEAVEALKERLREQNQGWKGVLTAIENRWNPTLGAERAKQRRNEIMQLKRRHAKELKDYEALLLQNKQLELEALHEQQRRQREQMQEQLGQERERYIREHEDAKRILADMEEERRRLEEELSHNDSLRDGPPPPKLGKT
jgi:hypothetical protein